MEDATSPAASDNYRFQRYIVALSGIILTAKFVAWYLTGSVAIFTDALESMINVAAGVMGLYALYMSMKPRDFDHPYGHGRAEFLSATAEGAMIAVAGIVILLEAVRRILEPPNDLPHLEAGLILVAVSSVANFAFGTFAVRKGKKNRSPALTASGKHLQSDSYSSFGIIFGLVALYVLTSHGYRVMWLDGAIAIIFGVIILVTGISVVKRSMEGIMDKVDIELLTQIVRTLSDSRHDAWIDIHNLRVVKYGTTIHIDMHVTMPWYMTIREQRKEVSAIIMLIKKDHGAAAELSVTCDPCRTFSCRSCRIECSERKEEFTNVVEWNINNLSKNMQHMAVNTDGNE